MTKPTEPAMIVIVLPLAVKVEMPINATKSSKDRRINLIRSALVTDVKEPFLTMNPKGHKELKIALKEIMIMHRKEDIKLPQPAFCQVERRVLIPHKVELDLLKLSQQQQDRVSSVAAISGCVVIKL